MRKIAEIEYSGAGWWSRTWKKIAITLIGSAAGTTLAEVTDGAATPVPVMILSGVIGGWFR